MIATMTRRVVKRIFILAACLAALSGCSMLRLGYNHLDIIAAWTADDYFDLEPAQRQEFLKRFDRLHEWHRYEQLPEYAAFLGVMKARLQKGLAWEDVLWFIEGAKERYRVIVKRSVDDAASLLLTVTPEQLHALQRRWDKDNRRFVSEYRLEAGPDEQRRARLRRVLSRIRDWTGHLDHEQEQKISAMANELPLIHGMRHQDRLRRQREFLRLMELRANREVFAARLKHWLLNWEEGREPEYNRLFAEWTEKQADFYVAVDRMLAPHQRPIAAQRIQNYIEDFTRLAERPGAHTAAQR